MKVLVACEYSGTVRDAFIAKGHDTMSCDLLPTEKPGPHYQGDVLDIIEDGWDLMIAHPPCTYLTCSAEWAYKERHEIKNKKLSPDKLYGAERAAARHEAVLFFLNLIGEGFIAHDIPMIAVENPIGIISTAYRKPDQTIQPYQFGEDASKATCLWLKNLPLLKQTQRYGGRIVEWPKGSGKMVERWRNQTDSGQSNLSPSADRWKTRSYTYPGIANAMAEQWSI